MRFERWLLSATFEPRSVAVRTRQELFAEFLLLLLAGRSFSSHMTPIFHLDQCSASQPRTDQFLSMCTAPGGEQERVLAQVEYHDAAPGEAGA